MTHVSVITIVHGRHAHLRAQRASLEQSTRPPDDHVVVAIDDPILEREGANVSLPSEIHGLPLAAARNLSARTAVDRGADVLVFLDVDCLAGRTLIDAYVDAVLHHPGTVWSGPVTYLNPPPLSGYDLDRLDELDAPHPARPAPQPGELQDGHDPDLFWSLSFACSTGAWQRSGGFCERYVGYGGEDTDYAHAAVQSGLALGWVGAARAYHQWHPVSRPPVEHLIDIVRNAAIFRERWGRTPMLGWLEAFERSGLVMRRGDEFLMPAPRKRAPVAIGTVRASRPPGSRPCP